MNTVLYAILSLLGLFKLLSAGSVKSHYDPLISFMLGLYPVI